jgi:hypothetical protein
MKKVLFALVVAAIVGVCAQAQVNIPLTGASPRDPDSKKTKPTSKMLSGVVTDKGDKPIPGAVVYLKNMKTLAVKSFFADKEGAYRFPQLSLYTDYEVYAEKDGKKSSTKSVSQFDDRFNPTINLTIDLIQ